MVRAYVPSSVLVEREERPVSLLHSSSSCLWSFSAAVLVLLISPFRMDLGSRVLVLSFSRGWRERQS